MNFFDWFFRRKMKSAKPENPHDDGTMKFLEDLQNGTTKIPKKSSTKAPRPRHTRNRPVPPSREAQGIPESRPSVVVPRQPNPAVIPKKSNPVVVPQVPQEPDPGDFLECRHCGYKCNNDCNVRRKCERCGKISSFIGPWERELIRSRIADIEIEIRQLNEEILSWTAWAESTPILRETSEARISVLKLKLIEAQWRLTKETGVPFGYNKSKFFEDVRIMLYHLKKNLEDVKSTAEEDFAEGVIGDRAYHDRRKLREEITFWESCLEDMA